MIPNKNLILFLIFSFFSCCGKKDFNQNKPNALLNEIHDIVDSIEYSHSRLYTNYIYTVTYQKKEDKDYIKVSTAEYFNKDSVSTYEIYNDKVLIFYSRDFFEKRLEKLDTTGLKSYMGLAYDNETISIYHPRYEVIEVLGDDKFRKLPAKEHHAKKLFYFDDRYVPEPEPSSEN